MNDAISVSVRVKAAARKESISETEKNIFEISVKERAQRGDANSRIRKLLASRYGVGITHVRIVKGYASSKKRYEIMIEK